MTSMGALLVDAIRHVSVRAFAGLGVRLRHVGRRAWPRWYVATLPQSDAAVVIERGTLAMMPPSQRFRSTQSPLRRYANFVLVAGEISFMILATRLADMAGDCFSRSMLPGPKMNLQNILLFALLTILFSLVISRQSGPDGPPVEAIREREIGAIGAHAASMRSLRTFLGWPVAQRTDTDREASSTSASGSGMP